MFVAWLSSLSAPGAFAAPAPAAVARATREIEVDGRLDEPDWQQAEPISAFRRYLPTEGGEPPGVTEIRFLQDERFLYVSARIRDAGYAVRARVSPREDINADDQIGIYLDTFHDGRSGYIFYLNPLGIQQDIRHSAGSWVVEWDTAFRSAGQVDEDGEGYVIEVAFPWRSLKFPARASDDPTQTWGLILTRKVPHEGAKYAFPLIHRNQPLPFSEEAELQGVDPPRAGSGLEIIPSLTASQRWSEDPVTGERPDFGELSFDPWIEAVRPSLDLRFGITPDLGLAGTLDPDFSQVELDVADVRLNPQFAFQFPERRPFFLDGVDHLQDPSDTLYTRSIAEPLAGLKLTGRSGPLSLGLLSALDRSPLPSITEGGTGGFQPEDVADRWAEDLVARIRADVGSGGLVGLTLAEKRIVPSPERPRSAGLNDLASVDLSVPVGRRWMVSGASQHSWTSAGPGTGGPAWGMASGAEVRRSSGIGTGGSLALLHVTDAFRREMGFLTQSGLTLASASLDRTVEPEGGPISTWTPGIMTDLRLESSGDRLHAAAIWQELVIEGVHGVWSSFDLSRRREADASVDGWSLQGGAWGQVGAVLELSADASAARGLDFGTLGPALSTSGTVNTSIRATRATRLDTTLSLGRHRPEGLEAERARLLRTRLTWQFSRPLGARLIVQEDRLVEAEGTEWGLAVSGLLTWIEVPGTTAYVGWTESIDLAEPTRTVGRTIFAKVSVLLRP